MEGELMNSASPVGGDMANLLPNALAETKAGASGLPSALLPSQVESQVKQENVVETSLEDVTPVAEDFQETVLTIDTCRNIIQASNRQFLEDLCEDLNGRFDQKIL